MKTIHIFDLDSYHNALVPGANVVPIYHRQRGAGLSNILTRYSIPIASKYLFPHAKAAAINTYRDIIAGGGVKRAVRNNAIGFLQNVGHDVLEGFKQKGSGISCAKRKRVVSVMSKGSKINHKKATRKKSVKKKQKPQTKKRKSSKKSKLLSKRDIFS